MNPRRSTRSTLADRVRMVRIDCFGDEDSGVDALATALGLLSDTWRNYEAAVSMPAEILLDLIELTLVNAHWLATGEGERYARTDPASKFLPVN